MPEQHEEPDRVEMYGLEGFHVERCVEQRQLVLDLDERRHHARQHDDGLEEHTPDMHPGAARRATLLLDERVVAIVGDDQHRRRESDRHADGAQHVQDGERPGELDPSFELRDHQCDAEQRQADQRDAQPALLAYLAFQRVECV